MLYVPDAASYTIENIGDRPFQRVQQNLMRWSGNTLRNGARALALGPRRCGFFIWWCVFDQRISIWTSLCGPVMALVVSFATSFKALVAYLVWVLFTRTVIAPKPGRSEEHTSELQSHLNLVCRLLLEKKKTIDSPPDIVVSGWSLLSLSDSFAVDFADC